MFENLKAQWEQTPLWQRVLVIVIFSAGVLFALHKFVALEEKKKINTLKEEIQNLRSEIKRYKETVNPAFIEHLKEELKKLEEQEVVKRQEFERIVGKVPYKEEVNVIIKEIGNIALSSGLSVLSIKIGEPRMRRFTIQNGVVSIVSDAQAQGGKNQQQPNSQNKQLSGVPLYIINVQLNLEGTSASIMRFFRSLSEKGIVSYPQKVELKPSPGRGTLSGSAIINIVAQVEQ